MRKIGETSGGTVICKLNKSDWDFLGRLASVAGAPVPVMSVAVAGGDGAAVLGDLPVVAAASNKTKKTVRKSVMSEGKPTFTCADCGAERPRKRKDQRFCSACSKKAHPASRGSEPRPARLCEECKKPFTGTASRKTCSDACTVARTRRKASAAYHAKHLQPGHTQVDRIAAIKAAHRAAIEKDPVERAGDLARESDSED